LEHNGVMFPPAYVRLPSNIKMKYDGELLARVVVDGDGRVSDRVSVTLRCDQAHH
jgi:hypothetical protein